MVELHENIPVRYYLEGIKRNPLQRFWHHRRFKNVSDLIERVQGEILDIGCADGVFTKIVIDKAKPDKAVGIDIVRRLIDDTKKRFKNNKKVKFIVADANNLPFEDSRFAAVFCLEALEHIIDPKQAVKEIKRVLKPGGYLIILVPTDTLLFKICWWFILHSWGRHWRGTHVQSFHSKNPLADLIESCDLTVEKDKKFLLGMLNVVKARKA